MSYNLRTRPVRLSAPIRGRRRRVVQSSHRRSEAQVNERLESQRRNEVSDLMSELSINEEINANVNEDNDWQSVEDIPTHRRTTQPTVNVMRRYDFTEKPPLQTQTTATNRRQQSVPTAPDSRKIGKTLIDKFSGHNSALTVPEWLNTFQAVTLDFTDIERLYALPKHLSDEALQWFAQFIVPNIASMSWTECKQRLTHLFRRITPDRMVEASKRTLQ